MQFTELRLSVELRLRLRQQADRVATVRSASSPYIIEPQIMFYDLHKIAQRL